MTEYIYLVGAEDVKNAGHNMQSAAGTMRQAASSIDCSLELQQRFLDEWLARFEAALREQHKEAPDETPQPSPQGV
jgi:Sec-independent protein translocase protein TatA